MNTIYKALSMAAVLGLTVQAQANETALTGEELPKVDTTITAFAEPNAEPQVSVQEKTKLTVAEEEQASELQQKAVDIYNNILTYDTASRAESVTKNLDYLTKALEKAQTNLKTEITNYKTLKKDVFTKKIQIDKLSLSQQQKDKRIVDLKESYEQRKDSMQYAMESLKKRIITLKERLATYQVEKNDLDVINKEKGANKVTWADKDAQRKAEALDTFTQIKHDLIEKEYDKYLQ